MPNNSFPSPHLLWRSESHHIFLPEDTSRVLRTVLSLQLTTAHTPPLHHLLCPLIFYTAQDVILTTDLKAGLKQSCIALSYNHHHHHHPDKTCLWYIPFMLLQNFSVACTIILAISYITSLGFPFATWHLPSVWTHRPSLQLYTSNTLILTQEIPSCPPPSAGQLLFYQGSFYSPPRDAFPDSESLHCRVHGSTRWILHQSTSQKRVCSTSYLPLQPWCCTH